MVIDMDSGNRIDDDLGAFREEVLNAQWLPPQMLELGLQQVQPVRNAERNVDVEAYLRNIYLNQE